MRSEHRLRVRSAHVAYDMTFARNITVIQGDSATGKTYDWTGRMVGQGNTLMTLLK